jgi:hypothetical protein
MKSKLTIFITTLLLSVWSLSVNSQTIVPKGKAQLIEFTNATAKFTVPAGKTWTVYGAFTSYNVSDEYTYSIFVKSINGTVLTDISKNLVGLLVYSSNGLANINRPLYLPENTSFELIVTKRLQETRTPYDNKAYLNYIEIDN